MAVTKRRVLRAVLLKWGPVAAKDGSIQLLFAVWKFFTYMQFYVIFQGCFLIFRGHQF